MGDVDLLDEIDDLKERLDAAEAAYAELTEERDRQLDEYEAKMARVSEDVETLWRNRLETLDREHREKYDAMVVALDAMRAAFSGDSSGWIEKTVSNCMTF